MGRIPNYFESGNELSRWSKRNDFFFFQCKYSTKSDVWSFAVCLWEILQLASVRPYADMEDVDVLAALKESQKTRATTLCLDRPPNCPRDLYDLLCECWKLEESDRPSFREIHLFLQRKNLGYTPLWTGGRNEQKSRKKLEVKKATLGWLVSQEEANSLCLTSIFCERGFLIKTVKLHINSGMKKILLVFICSCDNSLRKLVNEEWQMALQS